MVHLEDEQVGEEDAIHEHMVTTWPKIEGFPVVNGAVFGGYKAEHQDGDGLKACVDKPDPELLQVKDNVMRSDRVQDRRVLEHLMLELEIEKGVPDVVEAREGHIEELADPFLKHGLAREDRVVAEHVLHHHIHHVLVEHKQDELSVPAIGFPPVHEQKSLQELELSNREVSGASSLHPLETCDTDTNVSLHDHVAIVGSIANRQGNLGWMPRTHQSHDVALLLGGDSAAHNYFHLVCALQHEF